MPLQGVTRYQEMTTQGQLPKNTPRLATQQRNPHPTVKPIALTRWLATLLLPPAEYAPRRLLNPFAGSGSEAVGAILAGWEHVTAIEREAEYVKIAQRRIEYWQNKPQQAALDLEAICTPSE
jgi:DNA modification methylase